jgi:hypothetical protein
MIEINLLKDLRDDPCPPIPIDWPTTTDFILVWFMGLDIGFLVSLWWLR